MSMELDRERRKSYLKELLKSEPRLFRKEVLTTNTMTFYEVAADWSQSRLPDNATEHARQLFDAINNAGAIDFKLLAKRNYAGLPMLNLSLTYLQRIGAIERHTAEVAG